MNERNGPSLEKLERYSEILRARGVPEAFVGNLAGRREGFFTLGGGLLVIVPFLFMLGAAWAITILIVADSWRIADASVARDRAWFAVFDGGVIGGISLVALVFAGICGCGWLTNALTARVGPYPAANLSASTLRTPAQSTAVSLSERMTRRAVKRAAHATSADDFLRAFGSRQLSGWRLATLAIVIPSTLGIALTHVDHYTVGPAGVTFHSWFSTKTLSWSEALAIETGCNSTSDDEDLLFYVHFPGKRIDVTDDGGFNFGRPELAPEFALETAERVDALLPPLARTRWAWLGRNTMAPRCLSYWFSIAGDDDRVLRLLRVSSAPPSGG